MLYLSAIILSFFLSFVLLTKKHKSTGDYILVTWLAFIGLHLLGFYLFFTGLLTEHPVFFVLALPLPLIHGPLLYLYTISQTSAAAFNKKQLLHFVPVVLSGCMFMNYFLLPAEQQLKVLEQNGKGYEFQMNINLYAAWLSGVVYVFLSLHKLSTYKRSIIHQFSNTEKINFNWLLYLIIWMVAIWLFVIFVREDALIFGAVSVFVVWMAYFGIKQVQVFSQHPKSVPDNVKQDQPPQSINTPTELEVQSKYSRSSLSDKDATLIHQRLLALMSEEQPYKDPDLTLNDLAKTLDIHPNNLSQVINTKENKSFYDLINERRVAEFIRLSTHPVSQQYTLLSLAYDCGFNSKASFNRNFKKHTGQTPSDYVKLRSGLTEASSAN